MYVHDKIHGIEVFCILDTKEQKMKFIAMPGAEKPPTVLCLHNADNGIVELWAYTLERDDGYCIGLFKDGVFVVQQMSERAKTLLGLRLTDTGHIVTKLQ